MLKIRRSHDRLIFNMAIPILGKTVFILRRGPILLSRFWASAALFVAFQANTPVLPVAIPHLYHTATYLLYTLVLYTEPSQPGRHREPDSNLVHML